MWPYTACQAVRGIKHIMQTAADADAQDEEYAACAANHQVRSLPKVIEFLSLSEKPQTAGRRPDARDEEHAACAANHQVRSLPQVIEFLRLSEKPQTAR